MHLSKIFILSSHKSNMKQIIFTFILLAIAINPLRSQERLGLATSNYAGASGVFFNPATIVRSPFRWDFNLVGVHVFGDNNYAYVDDVNIPKYVFNPKDININNQFNKENKDLSDDYLIKYKDNPFKKHAYASALAHGPSIIISREDWSFGFHTAVRTHASVRGIPAEIARQGYEGLDNESYVGNEYHLGRVWANQAAWNEIGITLGKVLEEERYKLIKGAVTLKRLKGYNSVYAYNKDLDVKIASDSSFFFFNIDAGYGYAPGEYQEDYIRHPISNGLAFDAGIVIENSEPRETEVFFAECPSWDCVEKKLYYNWRLGFSLLDVGYLRFKDNAQTYIIKSEISSEDFIQRELESIDELNQFDSILYEKIRDIPDEPQADRKTYSIGLPWAASVQFDYNLGSNFFVNSTIVQRIPHFGRPGVDRTNILAVTPRYDLKRFGFSVPIVMYQYVYPRIGAALRINNNLLIGTDKIGAFIGNRVSGVDFYFSLKINAFKKCKKSNRYQYNNRIYKRLKELD